MLRLAVLLVGDMAAAEDTYRWAAATLVLVARQQTTIHGTAADPALARYSGVSCGNLPQYEAIR